jgi:uncharacterized protein (DUF305 family)
MRARVVLVLLLVFSLLLLSACAGGVVEMPGMADNASRNRQNMDQATAMPMDHSTMQMDASKSLDAQFIDSMIEHHQGAIEMAQEVLQQADHAELKTMAEAIIATQSTEIEQMRDWRNAWYVDLPPTGGMEMSMGDMMISHDERIPFDQRFLTAMISHHQGAIEMAKMAQQMAEHQEIKELADAIITAQQAEIEQMQAWLQAWFPEE